MTSLLRYSSVSLDAREGVHGNHVHYGVDVHSCLVRPTIQFQVQKRGAEEDVRVDEVRCRSTQQSYHDAGGRQKKRNCSM